MDVESQLIAVANKAVLGQLTPEAAVQQMQQILVNATKEAGLLH
jgi:hypothetical protein